MLKNNSLVFSDSALNKSLKESGWEARAVADDTEKTAGGDKSDSIVQMGNGLDETDGDLTSTQSAEKVPNAYVGKRNFIHQLMDVALMMANVSQLKALLASENEYYYLLLTFICMSIGLQVVFTMCMLVICSIERTIEEQSKPESMTQVHCPKMERMKWIATCLDRAGSVLVLFVIVSNVFIAGFGVENHIHSSSKL